MDLLRQRRETNQGLGDAVSTSFEFAATTAIFLGLGWLLDRWVGSPSGRVALAIFCIVGKSILLRRDLQREDEALGGRAGRAARRTVA